MVFEAEYKIKVQLILVSSQIGYNIQMDKKSKYLIFGFIFIFAVVAYWDYRIFFIERDFVVNSTTECNPQTESCFVLCDGGECETNYYAKITKRAYNIPICNEAVENCNPLICEQDEVGCEIVYCSESSVQDNEMCTNPKDFQVKEIVSTSTESIL